MSRYRFHALALVAIAAALAAALGVGGAGARQNVSGKITMIGVWTSVEQKSILAVIAGFNKKYPDVKVKYTSAGNNTPTVLATAIQGGHPPDVAAIAQPAVVRQFAQKGALKPITFARAAIKSNLGSDGVTLGSAKGKLYGVYFKASNKSTVWYSVKAFKDAGVKPVKTWPQLLGIAKTLRASGIPAYSIGGAEGWTLTDVFENIYLRSAGPKKYDLLTDHKIKWTDPSVKTALRYMAQILSDTRNIVGGTAGALQTDSPTAVNNVLNKSPKAAMILEGDFVPGTATTGAKSLVDFNMFPFPSIKGSPATVLTSGDIVVMFKDSPAARAFINYLTTPEAATIWAKRSGIVSPNRKVPLSAYKDPLTRRSAAAFQAAKVLRFDLSDLEPPSFGATTGQGEWKLFQDFLKNPNNVNGIAAKLEKAAAKAFKK